MTAASIADPVLEGARADPGATAFVYLHDNGGEREVSRGELLARAGAWSSLFATRGVGPADLILVAVPHSPEQIFALFGALLRGAIPSLFPYPQPQTQGAQLRALAAASAARAVVVDGQPAGLSNGARPEHSWVLIDAGEVGRRPIGGPPAAQRPLFTPGGGEDIAYLQFTSGTTGLHKGVNLSHRAILHLVTALAQAAEVRPRDVCVNWLPLYHDLGLFAGLILPLLTGARALLMSPFKWTRRPAAVFQAIHRHRATVTWAPNAAYHHALAWVRDGDLAGLDLSTLRFWGCGGEPVLYASQQAFLARFGPHGLPASALLTGYGMAENTLCVTINRPGHRGRVDWVDGEILVQQGRAKPIHREARGAKPIVSSGSPIGQAEVRIVRRDGTLANEREVGEIRIRTRSLFSGYRGNPDLTARVYDAEGWYRTGDSGYVAEGELFVFGRRHDLIKHAGHGIYPQDLESIAASVAGVRPGRVVAFGVPDERLGSDRILIACELEPWVAEADLRAVQREVCEQVYQQLQVAVSVVRAPRGLVVRTANGKLARAASRARYESLRGNPRPSVST